MNEKTVSAWKKNNSLPPVDKISKISDCLGVTIDYLITGKENFNNANISNSTVGTVGGHLSGTITINNNSALTETESENREICISEQILSENAKELLKVFPQENRSNFLVLFMTLRNNIINQIHKTNQYYSMYKK